MQFLLDFTHDGCLHCLFCIAVEVGIIETWVPCCRCRYPLMLHGTRLLDQDINPILRCLVLDAALCLHVVNRILHTEARSP